MSPSFEDAYAALKEAEGKFPLARSTAQPDLRDSHLRRAFYDIYQAARIANMLYVNSRRKRGVVEEGGALSWAKREFEDFTVTLYVQYFSRGAFPKDDCAGEFYRWFERAREYINRLYNEAKAEQSVKKAHDWTDRR